MTARAATARASCYELIIPPVTNRRLPQAVRSPLSAIARGYRYWRGHGKAVRRARLLRAYADGLSMRRAPGWGPRADRLYRRALRTVDSALTVADPAPAPPAESGDPRRRLLRVTAPYRSLAAGLAVIAALVVAVAVAGVLLAAALSSRVHDRVFPSDLAQRRLWVASSADAGAGGQLAGTGPSTRRPFFFATSASDHPWVRIDLGHERLIRSFRIENRTDCCVSEMLPLNIEVQVGADWLLVAQRRSPFEVWTYDVKPVRARLVRVRLAGSGLLRLKRIAVYGE